MIAVNPPRTRLAPLGAARETIDSADWQSVVAGLMARSSLIVLVAPGRKVTDGLRWELESVSAGNYLDKALIVVPPVRAEDLQRRWQEFQHEGARLWPFTVPGPVADPHALVLAFRHPRVDGDRRGPADRMVLRRRPEAGTDQIKLVISTYFLAINGRDYTAYQTTQSPGQALTAGQFQTGSGPPRTRTWSSRASGRLRTGARPPT